MAKKIIPYVERLYEAICAPTPRAEAEFDSALIRTNGGKCSGYVRTGKSSETVACAERLRKLGWKVIEEDAQGKTSKPNCSTLLRANTNAKFGDRILQAVFNDTSIASAHVRL